MVTYYVLVIMDLSTRRVHLAGITHHPDEAFMMQCARQLTDPFDGFLLDKRYLLHDRDTKFCAAFKQLIDGAAVKRLPLPPRSPNLNAIAERWVRSVKSEALSPFILFGERSLRHVRSEYLTHYHAERCHQGLGNMIPFPSRPAANDHEGPIECDERLGGMLKFYNRKVA